MLGEKPVPLTLCTPLICLQHEHYVGDIKKLISRLTQGDVPSEDYSRYVEFILWFI